jgi:hypothetical protein
MTDKPSLLVLLASGLSASEAARRTGISRRTICRRLKDPAFREQIFRLRERMLDRSIGAISRASIAAARTLAQLLGPSVKEGTRLAAAKALLEQALHLRGEFELEGRIAALEAKRPNGEQRQ